MDLGQLANGLASNPLAWFVAILLLAVAYLFKELRAADKAALERAMVQEAAHRETLMRVIPVAEKLTDSVALVERMTSALLSKESHA